MHYPIPLSPTSSEFYKVDETLLEIPVVNLLFERWRGADIANTFGGKPLIDFEGKPVFAELAIRRIAANAGWSSRWIETYAMKGKAPYYFTAWQEGSLAEQISESIGDPVQTKLLEKIAAYNGDSFYGCWDVIAWKDETTLFMESKRNKRDKVRDTQLRWVKAGLKAGLSPENFLFVQWDFVT